MLGNNADPDTRDTGGGIEHNDAFKDLPRNVQEEIRKLGWSGAAFSQHMLKAIERACMMDGKLVDDPHANPFDIYDMMELTREEATRRHVSPEKPCERTYWRDLVENSRQQPAQNQFLSA